MRRLFIPLAATILAALLIAGCSQPAPPPAPTKAPAAPTAAPAAPTKAPEPAKPVEPTKAAAPQPTAAPAKPAINYPEKGKSINVIVPWPAGGPVDTAFRILGAALEKELGVPMTIVVKAGANSQIGLTDLAQSKPDGYTIGATNMPTTAITYLDAANKAVYSRKDFIPVAGYYADEYIIATRTESPFKSLKDLVDAAKANPGKVTLGDTGATSSAYFAVMTLEEQAGVKFANVHLEGGAAVNTNMIGGHIDAALFAGSAVSTSIKSGAGRLLAMLSKEESKFYPGVKTAEAQGYKVYGGSNQGISVPAGTPKEIVDILAAAVKKATDQAEVKSKLETLAYEIRYQDTPTYVKLWDEQEVEAKRMIPMLRR